MSDPATGIAIAALAIAVASLVIRRGIQRQLPEAKRAAVHATARAARRWLVPAFPVVAIAYYLCWQAYSVVGLMAVLLIGVAYSSAVGFVRFRRLLHLDLPRGYYLAFGLGMAVIHFGLAAYLWSVRAAFI
jgi:hypothetical protein